MPATDAFLAALLTVLLLTGVAVADTDWTEFGSATVVWGTTHHLDFEGLSYNITPDDFSRQLESVYLSVICGGVARETILHENECFEWDDRIKIELTDISTDSSQTPRAHLTFYRGDSLELDLELTLSVSEEVYDDLTVSSAQYAPGEEKTLELNIKNIGNSDIDAVEVCVSGGMLLEDMEPDDLGTISPDASELVEITVRAPEWDGSTDPCKINYSVGVVVSGETNNQAYSTNESVMLHCTSPLLRVVRSIDIDEIDVGDTVILWVDVYNVGFYPVSDVNLTYGATFEGDWVLGTVTTGSLDHITGTRHYSVRHTTIPAECGTYKLGKATATLDFFGRHFAWSSDAVELVVHGAKINILKTISYRSNNTYDSLVTVKNTGDRSAQVTVHDLIPAGYVDGSVGAGINEHGGVQVSPHKINVSPNGVSCTINVTGIVLKPNEHLKLPYQLIIGDFNHTNIPPATVNFGTLNSYHHELQSSCWMQGVKLPPSAYDLAGHAPPEPKPTAESTVIATVMETAVLTAPIPTAAPGAHARYHHAEKPNTSKLLLIVLISLVLGVGILFFHQKLVKRGRS